VTQPQRVIIISDRAFSAGIFATLEHRGFEVTIAQSLKSAYLELLGSSFDLVFVDLAEGSAGVDFIRQVRAMPELKKTVIVAIGKWGSGQAVLALSEGADAYEPGPFDPLSLFAAVERMLLNEKAVAQ